MLTVFILIYVIAAGMLFYTYIIYPFLLHLLSAGKALNYALYDKEELPDVLILFSVYNGEKVIAEKISSMLNSDYPEFKLRVLVGSDESNDTTDSIVQEIAAQNNRVTLYRFSRRGKANVLNALRKIALEKVKKPDTILVYTDVHAIFDRNTLFEMVKYFKDERIGIVGATYINTNVQKGGISIQERAYIQRENVIKLRESILFGRMMGVYGACYAIRAVDMPEFPHNILMEDFYVTQHIHNIGKHSILSPESKFYLSIPNSMEAEFSRKRRIAAGNFQNLFHFPGLLSPLRIMVSFPYWSHKVLRWLGPIWILLSYIAVLGLVFLKPHPITYLLLGYHILILLVPVGDELLKRAGIDVMLLRYIHYFLRMNVAIVSGFVWFVRGIKTNVWQPTNR
ncbi:MAG: glycosyltransferase [Chitinophagales bacterium]|nr:glycosyltransferase [Chitinophagales bacterium]MDW8418173.1 glycosyltransferase [Chitinophagales bacterium]